MANAARRLIDMTDQELRALIREEVVSATMPAAPDESDWMTLAEAAAFLKTHPRTLAIKARAGKVPHAMLGDQYRFSRRELSKHMNGQKAR